ncbi:glycosyltransferase [Labilibacter marinus]|uniref:glycosyltransferase n=1 Tax=Labilibacter marinus TaxID=1477105 RepID=UPI000836AD8B|nr:glycosyltransferase [Labilibacter marinus]
MHILKIIHGYPPYYNAGSEVYSQSIVDELKKTYKITVFTREENEYIPDFNFRRESGDGADFVFVNMARGKDGYNHAAINKRLAELIEDIKPDVAHIGHLNHLSTGIVDELNKQNIPILFTLHDFWLMCPRGQFLQRNFDGENLYKLCDRQEDSKCAESCYRMYQSGIDSQKDSKHWAEWVNQRMRITKEVIDKVDCFHAPSKYLMNRFIDDFDVPKEKIFYLDYGFPTHYLKPEIHSDSDTFTFGYIGTHIAAKGVNLLIEAFKGIEGKAKLKIFGRELGQSTKALKKLSSECSNPVEFCGEYINHNLAKDVFSKVHAIVVPSIWGENSPLVIHEAQSCHIPVITADFGGMKEYVQNNVNGLLFQHRNLDSLREKLQFAVSHAEKMNSLGRKGYLYSGSGEIPNIIEHCQELYRKYNYLLESKNAKTV